MSERLGSGLQNRAQEFDSPSGLKGMVYIENMGGWWPAYVSLTTDG